MRTQSVICFGQIQMILVGGAFHHGVLATHLDILKHVIMPVVLPWFLQLTNLYWEDTIGVMIKMCLPFSVHPTTVNTCGNEAAITGLDDTSKCSFFTWNDNNNN